MPCFLRTLANGAARYRYPELLRRTLNTPVSPIAVPLRHANDKTSDLSPMIRGRPGPRCWLPS
jgi:hypothetical protein